MSDDARWMARALELAGRGWGRVAPNPLVGAVIVRDGELVGEGWHTEYGHPHAEVEALRAAGEAARGATAFVTLEPCSHHGKTPPCTGALLAAGIRRVVFAASDPNPKAAGGGEVLREAGVEVLGGVMAGEARDQNAVFFHTHSPAGAERPFVALKLALTLDGRIADHAGSSVWITGDDARSEVHRLRAGFDAVAVGSGTALADDPKLTVRGALEPRVPPVRVVFDRRLRLPLESALVTTAREVPVMVVAGTVPPAEHAQRWRRAVCRYSRAATCTTGCAHCATRGSARSSWRAARRWRARCCARRWWTGCTCSTRRSSWAPGGLGAFAGLENTAIAGRAPLAPAGDAELRRRHADHTRALRRGRCSPASSKRSARWPTCARTAAGASSTSPAARCWRGCAWATASRSTACA
jgi:diaminohydroxyphosphoribosylaminopyrimidine deaminase/5-amino-6-(5-phosphoribosylamino)uracil reductase